MPAGVGEENVQFQTVPLQLDAKETDLYVLVKMQNRAIRQLQEYVNQMRTRIVALEERVLE